MLNVRLNNADFHFSRVLQFWCFQMQLEISVPKFNKYEHFWNLHEILNVMGLLYLVFDSILRWEDEF